MSLDEEVEMDKGGGEEDGRDMDFEVSLNSNAVRQRRIATTTMSGVYAIKRQYPRRMLSVLICGNKP